jgi:hypothetical protein
MSIYLWGLRHLQCRLVQSNLADFQSVKPSLILSSSAGNIFNNDTQASALATIYQPNIAIEDNQADGGSHALTVLNMGLLDGLLRRGIDLGFLDDHTQSGL